MTCVRRAWLDLYGDGTRTVALEDTAGGWFCSSLDLGYPEIRDVVTNRPDQSGVDDRTALAGGRVIQATVEAIAGAGATIDAVAAAFAPFMVPAARPTLHYVLERPGNPERSVVVRASGYAMPIEGPYQREINLQWLAADPAVLDPTVRTATAWAGSSAVAGRTYPLVHNRIYPVGGASATTANIRTSGDLAVRPVYRIYGPATRPIVSLVQNGPPGGPPRVGYQIVGFLATFTVSAGHYVEVDSLAKTARMDGDPAQSVLGSVDWQNSKWTPIQPNPAPASTAQLSMTATSTSGVTQVQAIWQDRYLT